MATVEVTLMSMLGTPDRGKHMHRRKVGDRRRASQIHASRDISVVSAMRSDLAQERSQCRNSEGKENDHESVLCGGKPYEHGKVGSYPVEP